MPSSESNVPEWTPQIELTEELATQIVNEQFPETGSLKLLGQGWDNVAFLSSTNIVFRLPQRDIAGELIKSEILSLPQLKPQLNLPIPDLQFIGQPSSSYPYSFVGYPMLEGVTADSTTWSTSQRNSPVIPLAQFLKKLHTSNIPNLNSDLLERKNPRSVLQKLKKRIDQIPTSRFPTPPQEILKLAESLATTIPDESILCPVHGDLYPRHILVDSDHQITGIIDWGDIHFGHQGIDLSIAYTFIAPSNREEFFAYYGNVSEETRNLAQLRALMYGCALLHYGLDIGDESARIMGETILSESIT